MSWGAPVKIVNPLGDSTRLWRGDPRFLGLVTRSLAPDATAAGFQESSATYDARGRLVATTVHDPLGDGVNVTSVHEYGDAAWPDFPTRTTSPTGLVSLTGYDASGNRVWQQATGDSARRVRFGYNADGQVVSVRSRAAEMRGDAAQTVEYDSLTGNLRAMTSPLGVRTRALQDRIGRDTASLSPIDSDQTKFQESRTRYDVMGRVTETQAIGPAVSLGAHPVMGTQALGISVPASSLWVRNYYTAGVLDSTRRWSSPDTAHIGTITTRWRYDNAGRTRAEISPDGLRDSTVYNAAGNVVEQHTRRGHVLRMTYDGLGRLTRRVTPGVTYGDTTKVAYAYTADRGVWVFPRFRPDAYGNHTVENVPGGTTGGITIAADTATFTYDRAGNMLTAINRDAKTRRTYFPGGALKADTQEIRNYAGSTFGHTYGIGYSYDVEGRLTKVTHPANIAPTSTTDVDYTYVAGTGELAQVADDGGTHAMTYDVEGRLTTMTAYGTVESFGYDADGRQVSERRVHSAVTWKQDSIQYDPRARQIRVATLRDTVENAYTGLGALARSVRVSRVSGIGGGNSASEEAYVMDALANNVRTRQYSRSLAQDADPPDPWSRYDSLQPGTGRLLRGKTRYDSGNGGTDTIEWHYYDAGGNRTVYTSMQLEGYTGSSFGGSTNLSGRAEQLRSYYGADEKLRVVDRRVCNYGSVGGGPVECLTPPSASRPTFEEYRYDALGRRVLTRTDQTFACSANCIDGVTRTVWDGDQVLYEIRRPMASAETETGVVPDGTLHPHQYGRVGYTHGGGLDKPLAIYRMDYDTMFPAAQLLAPHTDARGAYEAGTHSVTGMSMPCKTLPRTVVDATPYPSDDPENPPSPHADSVQVCVKVDFPAAKQWMTYRPRNTSQLGAYAWWGSLISGSRDASGQMYMRNRYYDPGSGRFTQEDPIGIAGGINLYGYAGGDPVNFSDAYGLCAQAVGDTIRFSVTVQCRDSTTGRRDVDAVQVTDAAQIQTLLSAVSRLSGGTSGYTASDVIAAYQSVSGSVYTYPSRSADGLDILTAGAAEPGRVAFRVDVWGDIQSGRLGRRLGQDREGNTVRICTVLGHEGSHLVQYRNGRMRGDPLNEPDAALTNTTWQCP
jgi:RHS repeat-associated protein